MYFLCSSAYMYAKLLGEIGDNVAPYDGLVDHYYLCWHPRCRLCGHKVQSATMGVTVLSRFNFNWDRKYVHVACLLSGEPYDTYDRWPTFIPERWRQGHTNVAKSAQLLLLLLETGLPFDIAYPVVALACWLL
jgi:hypothetical protein